MNNQKIVKKHTNMREQLITTYEITENEIHITSPYCANIVQTCKRWGGKWDTEKLVWVLPIERLKFVHKHLGDQSKALVRVQVDEYEYKGNKCLSIGLYALASRRERNYSVTVHADAIEGYFPPSGGSRKYPRVNPVDVVFALWVPHDFAIKKDLQILEVDAISLLDEEKKLQKRLKEIKNLK